jgi:hypothetical protein
MTQCGMLGLAPAHSKSCWSYVAVSDLFNLWGAEGSRGIGGWGGKGAPSPPHSPMSLQLLSLLLDSCPRVAECIMLQMLSCLPLDISMRGAAPTSRMRDPLSLPEFYVSMIYGLSASPAMQTDFDHCVVIWLSTVALGHGQLYLRFVVLFCILFVLFGSTVCVCVCVCACVCHNVCVCVCENTCVCDTHALQ